MNGRLLILGFAAFLALFAGALVWFQIFAYYERQQGVGALTIGGQVVPISDYDGIDATSSPLKLRGCFRIDPSAVAALEPVADATPLTAPFWFRCFSARALTGDLASGTARAYRIAYDEPEGFDLMLAIYPDSRGFVWRQLNAELED